MSVEFELQRIALGAADVRELARAWLSAEKTTASLLEAQADFARVFLPGRSIRGFSLRSWRASLRNRIEVQLSVCASRADWSAAYSFLRFARDGGYTVQSPDGAMSAPALVEEKALQKAREQLAADVRYLWTLLPSPEDERVELPIDRFVVPIGRHELPPEPLLGRSLDAFERTVQERAGRYALATSVTPITLATGATAIIWSGDPILTPLVGYVIMTPDMDPAHGFCVPWAQVVSGLADRVENTRLNPPQYYLGAVARDAAPWTTLARSGVLIGPSSR